MNVWNTFVTSVIWNFSHKVVLSRGESDLVFNTILSDEESYYSVR